MPQRLQHIIWNAMNTNNSDLCQYNEKVGVFNADIAPFAAMKNYNEESFRALYDFITEPRALAIITSKPPVIPDIWQVKANDELYQMICLENKQPNKSDSNEIVPLGDEHIPQMIELTSLTKPGPFLQKTILFGPYFGIFDKTKLIAMAGIRLSYDRFREVSAVCTHPDYVGKGYGQKLMTHVMNIITNENCIPFLHVRKSNDRAIGMYKMLGFGINHEMNFKLIRKKEVT